MNTLLIENNLMVCVKIKLVNVGKRSVCGKKASIDFFHTHQFLYHPNKIFKNIYCDVLKTDRKIRKKCIYTFILIIVKIYLYISPPLHWPFYLFLPIKSQKGYRVYLWNRPLKYHKPWVILFFPKTKKRTLEKKL